MIDGKPRHLPERDEFDERMVSIESAIFDLQISLLQFVANLVASFGDDAGVDIPVRVFSGDDYAIVPAKRIYFDRADELLKIELADGDEIVASSLDIGVLEHVARQLLFRRTSDRAYRDLAGDDEVH
ncbi:MAG TPA: hypothetical protein PLG31_02110 [Spirochaetota bacterium]|nr:hypothetical protein [Spirochaetota bacterium]